MIDKTTLIRAFGNISEEMEENRDRLIRLDQQNGDGDLGISMCDGFRAAYAFLKSTEETDLARILSRAGNAFNEAAPSSLGTILSFFMKGMARELKGKEYCDTREIAAAMRCGIRNIMDKAGSKPGEKTILDALDPAVCALEGGGAKPWTDAAQAAAKGSEATKQMKAVWGRAAYYGENSIGILDGGSCVGALIFKALEQTGKEGADNEE